AAAGKPVAGICLGAQLLARAHGGTVAPMEFPEFGFTRLSVTPEGRDDPVLGKDASLPLFMEYHQDAFTLPPGGLLLVRGEACANQMFRVGRSYGFQFHLEAEAGTMAEWIREMRAGRSYISAGGKARFNADKLDAWLKDLPALSGDSALSCARMAENWLRLAEEAHSCRANEGCSAVNREVIDLYRHIGKNHHRTPTNRGPDRKNAQGEP
ncbi:MAG: type 1 glutamine amidotransferase, partial [Desulfovibrio sp.]|nr:type 1 glutamine amidotransferase [Desulfovibrio sp.]